ncbi:Uncharacterised protein [Collinsella aerofaciens]|uniref:Uncharacterized protein n=1 Tax=Collinsella aerofaciens TaxID=74426 RepID=A0A5K1JHW4_9ACTN|nr:Uncharacterised protein [Collinsella aerofaciens]
MALEFRCLDLGDFLVNHLLRDGGFAELGFVECVSVGVLRYHIEFATRFVYGAVVPVLAYGVEGWLDHAGSVLSYEVLATDFFEHMRDVVFLEVLEDMAIIKDLRVEQLTRGAVAEDIAIVKERKRVHHKVAGLALVRRVVDGRAFLDDLERYELVERIGHGRAARDVRLRQHVSPTGVALREGTEYFVGVGHL